MAEEGGGRDFVLREEFLLIGEWVESGAPIPFSTNCHNKHEMKARPRDKRKALQMEWKATNNSGALVYCNVSGWLQNRRRSNESRQPTWIVPSPRRRIREEYMSRYHHFREDARLD
ncbi:hypothetical protein TNCV_3967371 [Trichonephila clavipes]|nr:hypothetical protein TNCV_3967371 [Trichonephila clavipes]